MVFSSQYWALILLKFWEEELSTGRLMTQLNPWTDRSP